MEQPKALKDKLTLLVCSCDTYEDLWMPFFSLLKKYWCPLDLHIILNTETKSVSVDGLNIECVHSVNEHRYGQRMLNALSHVKTEYVLLLLDDFFIREPVCEHRLHQMISWMDADANIAYFSCESLNTYTDYEFNKFQGFKRVPPANYYTLNMQAAIWRTEILRRFWHPTPSPWEWENLCNLNTLKFPQYKFYCAIDSNSAFLQYGHRVHGDVWGVCRGKWVVEDVAPLFEKENINIDISLRGVYSRSTTNLTVSKSMADILKRCKVFCDIRNIFELPFYVGFEIHRMVRARLKHPTELNYITYRLERAQKRFLATQRR